MNAGWFLRLGLPELQRGLERAGIICDAEFLFCYRFVIDLCVF